MRSKLSILSLIFVLCATSTFAGFRTGQVTLGAVTATQVGSTAGRIAITIVNEDGAILVYCGPTAAVTALTGVRVSALGGTLPINENPTGFANSPVGATTVYCIGASGTPIVSFIETTNQ